MKRFIKDFFKLEKKPIILLGRWNRDGFQVKNIYANHDHCGDIICKDPKLVTEIVKKEVKKK